MTKLFIRKYLIISFFILLIPFQASAINFRQSYVAAVQKNEGIGQKHEDITQAEERVRQARGAIMPNISASATHQRQDQPADPFARQFSPATQDTAKFNVKQPIFHGFGEFAAMRERRRLLESSEYGEMYARVKLYQELGANYFNILSYEQDLRNLREQVDLYAQRVRDLQGRAKRGESNVTEALTAQSTQASLEAEIQLVSGQLSTARETFAFTTGLPAETPLEDESSQGAKLNRQLLKVDEYVARVENRPDIRSAIRNAEAAHEEVRVQRAGHWPSIDVEGNYYMKRPVKFLQDIKWDVEITMTVPLFEGGSRQAKVREAASKQSTQDLELAKLRRQAVKEIRSFYQSLQVRLNQVSALEKTVGLAEKNYKVLQREFRNGLVRSIDAQVALTEFRVARRTYDQARYSAQVDLIGLEAAAFMIPIEVTQ
jgi:outer membrane protein